jgi:hypothetical protein
VGGMARVSIDIKGLCIHLSFKGKSGEGAYTKPDSAVENVEIPV